MKFSGKIGNGPVNKWLNFGGDDCLGGGMHYPNASGFGATVCKTAGPVLSDRCLSVCNVGVLWPNS